ncbi:MAG TPA: 50S ribosomal protein L31 [Myxococcota bacterium]|jgi:large subunit ribosomal protein L31|nr:50S ribosomal protein L31 [Myxococcota bacterium]
MRQVHPEYEVVTITCACGASFQTRSTRTGEMQVEICAECHPFYTGKQKIVDRAGRVERFKKRYDEAAAAAPAVAAAAAKKKPAKGPALKKPPKMGKVVPIEVKPAERFGDDKGRRGTRGKSGPGDRRGRGAAPAAAGAAAPAEGVAADAAAPAEGAAAAAPETKE